MRRSSKDRIISNGGRKLNRLDRENNIKRFGGRRLEKRIYIRRRKRVHRYRLCGS